MSWLRLVIAVCAVIASVSADHRPCHRFKLRRNVQRLLINTEYAGEVTIGSQTYLLVFDTSSPNVILASPSCIGGSCSCSSTVAYSGTKRGSGPPIIVTYFDTGKATGQVITEPLTIVNLTSPNQGIVLANILSIDVCLLGASGVVGLAPAAARTNAALSTVFDNFARLHLISNIFSIHHARYSDGEHFGELILGGTDDKYVSGPFTTAQLVEPASWKFKLDQVLIGNNVAGQNTLGFIDTSKNIILGPDDQVNQINQAIGCTTREVYPDVTLCELSCNRTTGLPIFAFVINGTNFNISSEYYIQRNGDICYSGFKPNGENYYMIGDFFIDHYYSEFNEEERVMRFAPAVEVV